MGSWTTTPPPKSGRSKAKSRDFSLGHLRLSPLDRETPDSASLWRQKPPDKGLGATRGGPFRKFFNSFSFRIAFPV